MDKEELGKSCGLGTGVAAWWEKVDYMADRGAEWKKKEEARG